jgi:hypothetical protein
MSDLRLKAPIREQGGGKAVRERERGSAANEVALH